MVALMTGLSLFILREYLRTFCYERERGRQVWIRWFIFGGWQIATILGLINLPVYGIISLNILFVLFVTFNYKGSLFRKIAFTSVYISIWILLEFLVGDIFIILGMDYMSQELMGSLLSKILLLAMVKELQLFFYNDKIRDLPHSYNMVLMLIPTGSIFVVYNIFMMSSILYKGYRIFLSFGALIIMLIINILIFTIYLKLSEDLELRQRNVVYKQEIEFYSKYIEEKKNTMLEFRKAKHDLKHQLIYLLELSERRDYDELVAYLEKLIVKEPLDIVTIARTDNSVIDALVNYKYATAKRHGIDFKVTLDVPMRMTYNNTDLCIILGNALDNALEANIRSNIDKHYIKLQMRLDVKNLVIIVENSFDGYIKRNKEGRLLSLKRNKENHGIGLQSIQNSVEIYNGFMKPDIQNNVFKLKIVLFEI